MTSSSYAKNKEIIKKVFASLQENTKVIVALNMEIVDIDNSTATSPRK